MRWTLTATIIVLAAIQVSADGIKFFKGTWEAALAEAKAQDKLIFMDCYTTWCGPCKAMARDVFTNSQVGDFYNDNFINVKMDMEKGEGRTLAQKYAVRAYPTLLFIDDAGKIVHQSKGAKPVDRFLNLGKAALKKNDKSHEYAKQYEAGKREPDFLRKYAYALKKAKKDYQLVVNEYLQTQKDITTPANLKVLYDLTGTADSRIFNLMIKHKSAILAQGISAKDFNNKIIAAATKTVTNAVEFKSVDLLKTAKTVVKTNVPMVAKIFAVEADMIYYSGIKEEAKFIKAANTYAKKHAKNNAFKLNEVALMVLKSCKQNTSFKKAEKWAMKAIKNGGKSAYYLTYAKLLSAQGRKSEAVKIAKEGRSVARENKTSTAPFEMFIRALD